jgi:hypothetical protein
MNKEKVLLYLEEIRDNVPAIYEAKDQVYFKLLGEIITYIDNYMEE